MKTQQKRLQEAIEKIYPYQGKGVDIQKCVADFADLMAFLDVKGLHMDSLGILKNTFETVYRISHATYVNEEFEKIVNNF